MIPHSFIHNLSYKNVRFKSLARDLRIVLFVDSLLRKVPDFFRGINNELGGLNSLKFQAPFKDGVLHVHPGHW